VAAGAAQVVIAAIAEGAVGPCGAAIGIVVLGAVVDRDIRPLVQPATIRVAGVSAFFEAR
jgi:hypothetical protein